MVSLPVGYYIAEVLDTAPILRQILILPASLWIILANLSGPAGASTRC